MPASISMTVAQKVQVTQYQTAEVSLTAHNVDEDMSPADIDNLLDQSKIVYKKIVARLRDQVDSLRDGAVLN